MHTANVRSQTRHWALTFSRYLYSPQREPMSRKQPCPPEMNKARTKSPNSSPDHLEASWEACAMLGMHRRRWGPLQGSGVGCRGQDGGGGGADSRKLGWPMGHEASSHLRLWDTSQNQLGGPTIPTSQATVPGGPRRPHEDHTDRLSGILRSPEWHV